MTDDEWRSRTETLEIRVSHQEAAIEELTRSVLNQEQLIREQAETIRRLEGHVRALTSSPIGAHDDETPPHY